MQMSIKYCHNAVKWYNVTPEILAEYVKFVTRLKPYWDKKKCWKTSFEVSEFSAIFNSTILPMAMAILPNVTIALQVGLQLELNY